jgi:hypothetical protein
MAHLLYVYCMPYLSHALSPVHPISILNVYEYFIVLYFCALFYTVSCG